MKLKPNTSEDIMRAWSDNFDDDSKGHQKRYNNFNKIKWYTVKGIIKYLDKEIEWYQKEYDEAITGAEKYAQRLYELRLLKRLRGELK